MSAEWYQGGGGGEKQKGCEVMGTERNGCNGVREGGKGAEWVGRCGSG